MNNSKSITLGAGALPATFDISTWRARTVVLIAAATLARLLFMATNQLTDTEAYYASWAHFPSLSYYDHPPILAWALWLTTFFSHSAFAVRIGSAICAAVFALLLYRFTTRLFSPRAGYLAVLIVTITPVFAFVSFLTNPEGFLSPLWLLSLILIEGLAHDKEWWRPILAGFCIGVTFDAKYTAILLVPMTLIFATVTPSARHWFKRPAFYLAGLVALLATLPVVVWNMQHDWPSIQLHLVERMGPATLAAFWHNTKHFFIGQIFYFHPLLFPVFLLSAVMITRRAFSDARFRLLALAGAPILLFFFFVMTRVSDAESHWPLVSYIPLIIGLAVWLDEHIDHASRALRIYAGTVVAISASLALIFFCYTQTPVLQRLLPDSIYDAQRDPVNEIFGWERIHAAINERLAALGPDAVVVGSHNVFCGHLLTTLDDHPAVYCASPRRTEFDFIGRREPPKETPFVYVDNARYTENVSALFPHRQCEETPRVEIVRGGKVINDLRMLLCAAEDATPAEAPSAR